MKKNLLALGMLGLAFQGMGQVAPYAPRFTEVNLTNSVTPPDYAIEYIHTVSPDVMWCTMYDSNASDASTAAGARAVAGTNGTQFEFFPITSPVAGHAGYLTSNIAGITDQIALAATFNGGGSGTGGGGEILRTRDGGLTWRAATTTAQFAPPDGFNNLVHMFDANNGVSCGDPNGGTYEVLTTSDGGATWTRNTSTGLVPTVAGEYGITRAFTTLGNTIWVAAGVPGTDTQPAGISRIFKNTDQGRGAWTAVNVPNFAGPATDLAFRDANNGIISTVIVSNGAVTGVSRAVTTDGGATWTTTNLSAPQVGDGTTTPGNGSFFITGLDAAQGKFISYGRHKFTGNTALADFGYSTSTDGTTWTNVQINSPFISFDVLDGNGLGFAGYITDDQDGSGGIFKTSVSALGTRQGQNAALQQALTVYPNPSAGGVFTLKLNSGVKAGTQVTVFDAMGRRVYTRELNGTAVNAQAANVDLSQQKAGVYTLELRTAEGTAQKKIVVQ
jgi:hypothetical protein